MPRINEEELSLEQIANFVISRAKETAKELIALKGIAEPPFGIKEMKRLKGIHEIIACDLGHTDGLLIQTENGYIIKLNAKHSEARRNFSCAHEIGHTFLRELHTNSSSTAMEFRAVDHETMPRMREWLCNVAAAEILMPETIFKQYIGRLGLSISSLEWIAHAFRVSVPAAAIRAAEVSEEPCIALQWQLALKKGKTGLKKIWCVGPGRNLKSKFYALPIQPFVTEPSILLKAYHGHSPVKSTKLFRIGNIKKSCKMESKGFGEGKARYVISLAFPDR
ncbi:MAG TPA: ImmA/IrrE family metallo-endopeptidase [Dehalococcoidia bacterium]|nr:ImmA/IrrE family metallo-endopeptidase [Dehalococcoidia bacterium]